MVDERDAMAEAEVKGLAMSVQISTCQVVVDQGNEHYYYFIILNSHGIPAVKGCVRHQELNSHYITAMVYDPSKSYLEPAERMMPFDVTTRWDSTLR